MLEKCKLFLKKEDRGKIFLYCLLLAAAFLTICSRSSFLYPCNNWDDANSYFSMGKFMMNGGVIYQNLYDQKGPYLYLLYGLAYLISNDSFFGVFIMEIIAITAFLFAGYRIMRLYCSQSSALLFLPVLAMGTLSSLSFYWGGAAEEFCIPMMAWSLYMSMHYFKEEYPKVPDWKMILLNGIFAGVIMQVKYIMLGFYFAWMAVMALIHFTPKNLKKSICNCFVFLGGMAVTMVPWLIYFGIHGALDDWYQCYIYNNIFLYSDLNSGEVGIFSKIYDLAKILYNLIWDNFSYFIFIAIGLLFVLVSRKNKWYEKINVFAMFGFLFLGIFIGGANIFYYSIPLMIFTSVGLGVLGIFADGVLKKVPGLHAGMEGASNKDEETAKVKNGRDKKQLNKVKNTVCFFACVVSFLLCFLGAYHLSMNTEYMKVEKEEHFLYQFKEIVQQEDHPTLLNVNMLDAGLYTVADVVPSVKYFQTNGINFEEMFEEQERYIREGITQFVICRFYYPEYILDKYELVAESAFATDGQNESMYYLFKRKE